MKTFDGAMMGGGIAFIVGFPFLLSGADLPMLVLMGFGMAIGGGLAKLTRVE